ncbi:MAG: tRNA (adenosine(37)-N6)-threonylcarbamoyltransferase complex dimerization subunit type 1 TsaB [Planctomycetes bacterium]|nr:tRNA (adenosine(37)-N6)-threonylcarbamoyltransferase complex dimerization subunit type 1 TsaB [Planctomycetota bacterium]
MSCDPANPPRIIAIETSSRKGSVALGLGATLLAEREFVTQADHARELLPTVDALCREQGWTPASLNECHISIGPGSFTGLRVAVTLARTWAFSLGVRVVAVPTLAVIAANSATLTDPPKRLAVILDAKRKQVFGSVFEFDGGAYRPLMEPALVDPRALLTGGLRPDAVIGEGIAYHREAVEQSGVPTMAEALWFPRAACVHRLGFAMSTAGAFTEPRRLVPLYIRRPEAEEVWEAKQAGRPQR